MPSFTGTVGNDLIVGTPEADLILALVGNDTVVGQNSPDWIVGNQGNDSLEANAGNDTLYGGKGFDTLNGGADADSLFGDAGDDLLLGEAGNDFLAGGLGNDLLFGGDGADALYGNQGNDVLNGDAGNDLLLGGAGNDQLFGSAGDDTLSGDLGTDQLTGGAGRDRFLLSPLNTSTLDTADLIVDFLPGTDQILLANGVNLANLTLTPLANGTALQIKAPDGVTIISTLAILLGVEVSRLSASDFTTTSQTPVNLPPVSPVTGADNGTFFSSSQGTLTINSGALRPPTAEEVRNNAFGAPIVANPLANIAPFVNPHGTQQIRDPFTGEFVPLGTNAPGSIFSPGGSPTTPGISNITPAQLPAGPVPPFYLDIQGIPRPLGQLTLGGGNISPFLDEGQLVTARPAQLLSPAPVTSQPLPPLYFDFQGIPRLASELAAPIPGDSRYLGFTGAIAPLLAPTGDPILAQAAILG